MTTLLKSFLMAGAASLAASNTALAEQQFAAGNELFLDDAPLSTEELGEARGGFSVGGFNFNFGVTITPVNVLPNGAFNGASGPLPAGGVFGDKGGPLPAGGVFGDKGGPLPAGGVFGDKGGPLPASAPTVNTPAPAAPVSPIAADTPAPVVSAPVAQAPVVSAPPVTQAPPIVSTPVTQAPPVVSTPVTPAPPVSAPPAVTAPPAEVQTPVNVGGMPSSPVDAAAVTTPTVTVSNPPAFNPADTASSVDFSQAPAMSPDAMRPSPTPDSTPVDNGRPLSQSPDVTQQLVLGTALVPVLVETVKNQGSGSSASGQLPNAPAAGGKPSMSTPTFKTDGSMQTVWSPDDTTVVINNAMNNVTITHEVNLDVVIPNFQDVVSAFAGMSTINRGSSGNAILGGLY